MTNDTGDNQTSLHGLILTGGRSTRMGHDKSLVEFHGKPQREFLFELLTAFCEKVFTSCKNDQQVPPHLNPLRDQLNIESPLNGILSAMMNNSNVAWLVVAADMPMINKDVLQFLSDHRDPSKVATCFTDSEGTEPEPLLSIWEPRCYEALKIFFEEGKISPRSFLKTHDIKLLTAYSKEIGLNINTPDELQAFKQRK